MFNNQYGQYYGNFAQPQMTQMNPYNYPNYSQQATQNGIIKVTGIDGAKAYQMQPNSVCALFDSNNDIFYLKTTDGAGFPTIRTFKFSEYNTADENQCDYVTRSEFNQLKEMILNGKQYIQSDTATNE